MPRTRAQDAARKLRAYEERIACAKRALGGQCLDCGSTQHLEFDHDPRRYKQCDLLGMWSRADFWVELDGVVLRCRECHYAKTRAEGRGGRWPRMPGEEVEEVPF